MATTVDAKTIRATKFPPEFSQKVDMKKVNVEVMKTFSLPITIAWIAY
jgi:serine/arginine repetitive matrix protein 1